MIYRIVLFIAVIALLPGCSKEGPQGPQGPQGNANVQSIFYDTNDNSWASSDGGITWNASFAVPEITADVLNNGAVLVYQVYSINGVTYNEQVPTYYPANSFNISAVVSVGYVDLYYESTNTVPFNNPGALSYRVVIIHGSNKKGYEPPSNEHLIKTTIRR